MSGSFRKSCDVLKKCLFKVSQTSFMLSFTLLKDIKTNFLCNIIPSLTRVFDQSFITPQLKSETAQHKHLEFIQNRSDIYKWDGVQEAILTTLRFSRFIRTFPQVCTLKQNLIIQGPRPFTHEDIWLEGQCASTNQVHWGEHIVLIQLKKGISRQSKKCECVFC